MKTPRLLILSASIGAGHATAGEALCQAYKDRFNGEAYHVDFLRYASPRFSRWIEQTYYLVTKHTPSVYRLLYQIADRPSMSVQKSEIFLGLRKYRDLIREYRPHAIISTHFFPASIVSYMYPRFSIPNGVVLTDYVAHHVWINPNTKLFFVAHQGMVNELKQLGVGDDQIRVTGIPIRPVFTQNPNRIELQKSLGLNPDHVTLLVMSGGNGIGPMADVLKALGRLHEKLQVIVISGHNQKMFRQLKEVLSEVNLKGQVLGFVNNVHEYMAVSDLIISKAGGLTVSESLTMGLPMAIIRPTPGQEDGNTTFLTNNGCGVYLENEVRLKVVVGQLLRNPDKLRLMRQNALHFAKPNATQDILTEMERLLQEKRSVPRG